MAPTHRSGRRARGGTLAPMHPTLIAVLAGGRSRRLGTDKAQLRFGDATWLERTAATAASTDLQVAVVGRPRPDDWGGPDVAFLDDAPPGVGPIGGLMAALAASGGPVLAIGCDTPLLDRAAFAWLLEKAASDAGPLGLGVRTPSGPEPLFSVYGPDVLPVAEAHVAAGRRSLRALLRLPGVAVIDAPPDVAAALANVNTPEDLARLRL